MDHSGEVGDALVAFAWSKRSTRIWVVRSVLVPLKAVVETMMIPTWRVCGVGEAIVVMGADTGSCCGNCKRDDGWVFELIYE